MHCSYVFIHTVLAKNEEEVEEIPIIASTDKGEKHQESAKYIHLHGEHDVLG